MSNLFKRKDLEIVKISFENLEKLVSKKLKGITGYDYEVWCSPNIGNNTINLTVDETTMTNESFNKISEIFNHNYLQNCDSIMAEIIDKENKDNFNYFWRIKDFKFLYLIRERKK